MQINFSIEGFISRVAKIAIAKDMPILVGLGDDEDPSQSSLKTWRIDPNLDCPLLIDTIPLVKGVAVRIYRRFVSLSLSITSFLAQNGSLSYDVVLQLASDIFGSLF